MAFAAARLFGRMQRNRGFRRAEAFALSRARRFATTAARRARGFVRKNPFTAGTVAGSAANDLLRGVKRYSRKGGLKGKRKARRIGPAAKPPTTPSARVSAKFAVAPSMKRFKKAKPTAVKVPKSAITHYKEFGQFNTEKCMYINHEHWGSLDKLWYGIALGLAKKLLPMAKIYNGKSLTDPCIGPRTSTTDPTGQFDNKDGAAQLRLVYVTENADGNTTRANDVIEIEDVSGSPDRYLSMDAIAKSIETSLRARYVTHTKQWLAEAVFAMGSPFTDAGNYLINVEPIYIQNLDDAEIHLYVNSLIKFQNVTLADHGTGAGSNPYDKSAIDANPLIGRVFKAKGHYPQIDSDLAQSGDKTLDSFFGNVLDTTGGITLLGHANTHTAADLGRISSIPRAHELYGNQAVSEGTIRMAAGAMKFHKTSFTFRKTFKALAGIGTIDRAGREPGTHTMFGFTLEHKHGEDSIQIGYNRDIDVGCYISHKRVVHPIKTNYTLDSGVTTSTVVPTEHTE